MKSITKKGILKLIPLVALAIAAVLMLPACGSGTVQSAVDGNWIISTIDGQSVADYATALGADEADAQAQWNISNGTLTATTSAATTTMKVDYKSDGFEVLGDSGKSSDVAMSVKYDSSAKTLTYQMTDGTTTITYVMVQGTYSFK